MPGGLTMPFPFLPWGIVTAGIVLGGMVGLFMVVAHLLDQAASGVSGTMLPGLVRGVRKWSDGRSAALPPLPSPRAAEVGDVSFGDREADADRILTADPELLIEPISDEPLPARERLHPHIR
jgi:hypothetical protein